MNIFYVYASFVIAMNYGYVYTWVLCYYIYGCFVLAFVFAMSMSMLCVCVCCCMVACDFVSTGIVVACFVLWWSWLFIMFVLIGVLMIVLSPIVCLGYIISCLWLISIYVSVIVLCCLTCVHLLCVLLVCWWCRVVCCVLFCVLLIVYMSAGSWFYCAHCCMCFELCLFTI